VGRHPAVSDETTWGLSSLLVYEDIGVKSCIPLTTTPYLLHENVSCYLVSVLTTMPCGTTKVNSCGRRVIDDNFPAQPNAER